MAGEIMQITKKSDSKGRLPLGADFANMTFLVEEKETGEVIVKKAVVVPENEMWLYKNDSAISSVKRGLKQAKARNFGHDPIANEKDFSWLDEIEE